MENNNQETKFRADINRENAKKSTGPRTPEGKARSRFNATRHRLTGQVTLLPEDDFNSYNKLLADFTHEYLPVGATELGLVATLATAQWRLNTNQSWEQAILYTWARAPKLDQPKKHHPQVIDAMTTAASVKNHIHELGVLSHYRLRDFRMFSQAVDKLKKAQAERKLREREEFEEAARFMALHNAVEKARIAKETQTWQNDCIEASLKNEPEPPKPASLEPSPYVPTKDGFVFSADRILSYVDLSNRKQWARELQIDRKLPQGACA